MCHASLDGASIPARALLGRNNNQEDPRLRRDDRVKLFQDEKYFFVQQKLIVCVCVCVCVQNMASRPF